MQKRKILFLLLALSTALALQAQEGTVKPHNYVTRATMYGIGHVNVYDTYISPVEYTGMEFRVSRESMRMTKWWDGNVSTQSFFQAHAAYTENKSGNGGAFTGLVNWSYGMHYQFRINDNLKLLAGGVGDFNLGFLYNLRNSNNPANAKAYINLAASGMAIYRFRIKRYPMTVRYQANLPLLGLMFSPNYGQSYYEIFTLKNTDNIVRFTSLHNQPSARQMLSVDFPISSSMLRFSYLCDIQQSQVNHLRAHSYSHVFMLGFVKTLYKIKDRNFRPAAY